MSDGDLEGRGIFSALKKVFGGGKKPTPKRKAPKKPSTGFNQFKYAPGAGCGTGAGGFKAGNNCSQGAGFNTPQAPKGFASKNSQIAASLPTKAADVAAYAKHLKKKVQDETAAAALVAQKAAQKAAQKSFAQGIVAKSKAAAAAKSQAVLKKAQEDAAAAAKRAQEKADAAKKAARAQKQAAEEAAAKAKAEADAKRQAEKDAARAAEKAQKAAEATAKRAADKVKKAEEEAAAKAAQDKATKEAMLAEPNRSFAFKDIHAQNIAGLELNGVKFEPPTDSEFWKTAGDSGRFKEPDFDPKHAGAKKSFGCIVVEPDGRVWLIEPKGHFGGYEHTFPKGGKDHGETNQQAAMREVFEESGLQVKIQGHLGDYEKTTSVTRYYIAKRIGGSPSLAGHETGTVKLVPFDKAKSLLNKDIDKKILDDAQKAVQTPSAKKAPTDAATVPAPPAPPGPTIPSPSQLTFVKNLGGSTGAKLMKGPDGKSYVLKQGNSSAHLRSEALADDLYDAAGIAVPSKIVEKDAAGVDSKVARFISGKTLEDLKVSNPKQYDAAVKALKKDFAADALLGNWDVVGLKMDNVVVRDGKVFRIDNGGALFYRAQGKMKGSDGTPAFDGDVGELSSMRDATKNPSAAAVYGTLTDKEVSAQITKLLKKKGDIMSAAAKDPKVAAVLGKRFDSLAKWQQNYKKGLKAKSAAASKTKVAAPVKPAAPPPQSSHVFVKAKEKSASELPQGTGGTSATNVIIKAYGTGEAPSNGMTTSTAGTNAAQAAKKLGITTKVLSWAERKWIGSKIKISAASKAAFSYWNGSSSSINHHIIAQQNGGAAGPVYHSFVEGMNKLPTFMGGPVFRGLHDISGKNVEKWIESGEWTSAPYHKITGAAQYQHQSFATNADVAASFATSSSNDKSVIVVMTNSKTAKDGCGHIGIKGSSEHEVVSSPEARHSLDSYWWIYHGKSNSHFKHGQTLTSEQYNNGLAAMGHQTKKGVAQLQEDPNLLLVVQISER